MVGNQQIVTVHFLVDSTCLDLDPDLHILPVIRYVKFMKNLPWLCLKVRIVQKFNDVFQIVKFTHFLLHNVHAVLVVVVVVKKLTKNMWNLNNILA